MSIDSDVIDLLGQIGELVASETLYVNKGMWSPSTEYLVDDVVAVDYSYWVCVEQNQGVRPNAPLEEPEPGQPGEQSKWNHLGVYEMAHDLKPSLTAVLSTKSMDP